MRKSILRKIRRVYQYWAVRKTEEGVKKCGPYWRGEYWENGKGIGVYIGKELPGSLRYLLDGRYKRPGCKDYTWPGLKEGGGKNVKTPSKRQRAAS